MKSYIINYQSRGNAFEGTIHVTGESLVDAQDKFLSWLKNQEVYQHMWNLNFVVEEIVSINHKE